MPLMPQAVVQSGTGELYYEQITSDVTISGTSSGAATVVIPGSSMQYDGTTTVYIEFWAAAVDVPASEQLIIGFYEDGSFVANWAQFSNVAAVTLRVPAFVSTKRTPTAGNHTYSVRAWRGSVNGVVRAASGYMPAFLRITRQG